MKRLAVLFTVLALAACGGQEGGTASTATSEGGQAPAVDAGGALDQAAEMAADAAAVAPVVKECVGLVKAAQFGDALPVCLKAVQAHPESAEAQAALDQAQEEAAKAQALDAAAQAEGAAAEAEGAAAEAEEAKKGLLEGIRQ
jgi:hypothetical protein